MSAIAITIVPPEPAFAVVSQNKLQVFAVGCCTLRCSRYHADNCNR